MARRVTPRIPQGPLCGLCWLPCSQELVGAQELWSNQKKNEALDHHWHLGQSVTQMSRCYCQRERVEAGLSF